MAEEKFEELGKESGQKRTAARTEERFPVEFERISESDARGLERAYLAKRTAEREDLAGGGDNLGDQFSSMGASQAQIQMFQQTVRLIRQLEDKVDQLYAAVTGREMSQAKRLKAMCIDLSSGGMRFITAVPLNKGDHLKIVIPLPPLHPVTVSAIGKVVKNGEVRLASGKKACEAAIQFTAINEQDQEEIVAYSFKRQREVAYKVVAPAEGEEGEN
ncbi:MAG: PilZ domain-containing protein [Candidatus Tectomicrobia bacterium]|uniref:PilZ domain-containing protein n=1 Tax=Tectimicrobiota bacterium TaxID=2528274 RepID=A0A932MNK4_UNCTE|nr:PilZ domain-containing protein [Candidatus Tectomicrobia bacterium]